jgi:hypothetical protein
MQSNTRQPNPSLASEHDAQGVASSAEQAEERRHLGTPQRLSPEERRRREEAVRFANASIGLEGFKVSAAAHEHANRFIAGEIDLAEFLRGE